MEPLSNTVSTALATQRSLAPVAVSPGAPLTILTMSDEQVQRIKLLAEMYAASTFNRSKPLLGQGDFFLIMLKGIELGISPTSSVDLMSIIQGVPVLDAKGILGLIKGKGLLEDIDMGGDETSYYCTMKRKGETYAHKEVFTIEDAGRLGFAGKDNYKKQARTMLKWRAVTACARVVFPDIIGGLYTHEEIDPNNTIVLEDGSMSVRETPQKSHNGDAGQPQAPDTPTTLKVQDQFTDDLLTIETRFGTGGTRYYVLDGMTLWTRQPIRELFDEQINAGFEVVLEEPGTHTLPDAVRAAYRLIDRGGANGELTQYKDLLRLHRIKTNKTVTVKNVATDSSIQTAATEDTESDQQADSATSHQQQVFNALDGQHFSDVDEMLNFVKSESLDVKWDKMEIEDAALVIDREFRIHLAWISLAPDDRDAIDGAAFWYVAAIHLSSDPLLTTDLLVGAVLAELM